MKVLFACLVGLLGAFALDGANADQPVTVGKSAAKEGFELTPGVIVDPLNEALYLMTPGGAVEKVALASGEVLWNTVDAAKPLALDGDALIAQAETAAVAGVLEIVPLNVLDGSRVGSDLSIPLPAGVWGGVDERLGRSLMARAAVVDGDRRLNWEYTERYVKGIAPPADEPRQQTQTAAYRLDFSTGQAERRDDLATAPPALTLPARVAAFAAAGGASIPVVRAGNVLATTQVQRDGDRQSIVLKRWDAASGLPLTDVELFSGPHVLQLTSADDRHLLVAQSAYPGSPIEYQWSIFTLRSGDLLAEVNQRRSHGRFFVTGDMLVFVEPAYVQRVNGQWLDEPRKLKAVYLQGSGTSVWERPLRDTSYRGAFPR